MSETPVTVGIDVSDATLDVTILPGKSHWTQPREDRDALIERLVAADPRVVIMEATGGLEAPVVAALMAAGLPVAVVNPRHVRRFAQSMGQLAKTDRIDAGVLADFAQVMLTRGKLRFATPADHERDEIKALVHLRQAAAATLVAEKNRLARAIPATRPHIVRAVALWTEHLHQIDGDIAATIRRSSAWRADVDLLRSIPGVGPITGPLLFACLPELGRIGRRAIASIVGVAPIVCDSGSLRGHRMTWGGRAEVRRALYMATLTATRRNPAIRACYQALVARGKPHKLAMVACMRKLLCIANTIMRTRTPWLPEYAKP